MDDSHQESPIGNACGASISLPEIPLQQSLEGLSVSGFVAGYAITHARNDSGCRCSKSGKECQYQSSS